MSRYIKNNNKSSAVLILKVSTGGIKKKLRISALNSAQTSTGKIEKITAVSETASNRIKATTL
ncbi:hypothetical protein ZPR_1368 [Zunongwangia profunda SM-A87]|uniref:Uncharacterized protein n=1 Tax=Zunongwangia profunda (strain DSM 18752 / CCTCC AB 206139 / SM-A87) TaxID=655815 RepID=D5BK24_ZUNPS|nr:hypothetical protein ZPR_1368 [Zunongwangia profunda SM-A87]